MRPFTYYLRVRYGECDAQKVVFNSRYGDYVDVAVNEFLRALGYESQLVSGELDFQLVKQTTEWRGPGAIRSGAGRQRVRQPHRDNIIYLHDRVPHRGRRAGDLHGGDRLRDGGCPHAGQEADPRRHPRRLRARGPGGVTDHAGLVTWSLVVRAFGVEPERSELSNFELSIDSAPGAGCRLRPMSDSYRTRDFAQLAGVSVKALRHYERVGLLKPRRTRAGHRRYTQEDLGRLEAITALKYLGFALNEIRSILNCPASELPKAIAARRRALGEAEARLTVARSAIEAAERASDAPLDALVEAVQTQVAAAEMKKYYTEEGWQRRRRYYEEGPAAEWRDLYRTLSALIDEDPGSELVQAAVDRWLALSFRAYTGDPGVQTDSPTAWADRERWPSRMKHRIDKFNLEAVHALVRAAAQAAPKKYFTAAAWDRYLARRSDNPEAVSRAWRARVDLFRDIEAALVSGRADRSGRSAQGAVGRAAGRRERRRSRDPAALLKMWADRDHWSASLRWQSRRSTGCRCADHAGRGLPRHQRRSAPLKHDSPLRFSQPQRVLAGEGDSLANASQRHDSRRTGARAPSSAPST